MALRRGCSSFLSQAQESGCSVLGQVRPHVRLKQRCFLWNLGVGVNAANMRGQPAERAEPPDNTSSAEYAALLVLRVPPLRAGDVV